MGDRSVGRNRFIAPLGQATSVAPAGRPDGATKRSRPTRAFAARSAFRIRDPQLTALNVVEIAAGLEEAGLDKGPDARHQQQVAGLEELIDHLLGQGFTNNASGLLPVS